MQRNLNLQHELVQGGDTAASAADTAAMLKLSVNLPMADKSIDNVRRAEVYATVLLPDSHPFLKYLRGHIKAFEDFLPVWETVKTSNPRLQNAKGVLHLQYLSLRLSKYWRAQIMTRLPVALDSPSAMFDLIEMEEPWEPKISQELRRNLKLDLFGGLGVPAPPQPADDTTALTKDTTVSGISGLSFGSPAQMDTYLQSLISAATEQGKRSKGGGTIENTKFEQALFGNFRDRKVGGKPVKCRDLRHLIKGGKLPQLPKSKVDGHPMCPAWHIKGICNDGCPRVADHVLYSPTEYQPLCSWCNANYPKDE